ncbi:transposase [Vreelandella arctica]|uniref:transposase n=1 Tax=Vreelandella arctica TaxID=3126499 RepID=UPI00300E0ED3
MGETLTTWSPSCNGSINVQLSGDATTSDAGTLLLREALDRSGVIEAMEDHLVDPRDPLRVRHSLASQIRAIVLQRAMGWYDLSDTGILQQDPLWHLACSDARGLTPLSQARPSQATLSRLLGCLGMDDNIDTLHEGLLRLAIWRLRSLHGGQRAKHLTLDIDGLPVEVFGHQGGLLREGNVGPAEDADTWIPHLVQRMAEGLNLDVAQIQVRLDAGFTDGETLTAMDARDIAYLGKLKSNSILQAKAEPYLTRPPGRPPETPREWCHDLEYQAENWESPRRVVLVVQENPDDLLFHAFFLVTNLNKLDYPPEKVLALYRKRGKAEAHMSELKSALNVHLSSTDRGASTVQDVMARNQVNLLLSLCAYQVLHGLRCLIESQTQQGWSLIRLREQLLKVAATITVHARQITLRLGAAADRWWPSALKALPRLGALS